MHLLLKFAYLGSEFEGYARQPNRKTIENEILKVLTKYKLAENFHSASRTDKGVSAIGNVILLQTNFKGNILSFLNSKLQNIWFYAKKEVSKNFNVRKARERWYRYYLWNENLDKEKIINAKKLFIGKHNFTNFARIEHKRIKTINSIEINSKGEFLVIDIKAESFLWNLVRRIVSCLKKIGKGEISEEDIVNALQLKKRYDFGLEKAENLILMSVDYGIEFEIDLNILKKIKEEIDRRLREIKLRESIFDLIMKTDLKN